MVIDNKLLFGGLNTDDEDRVIPNGDYRFALNIRNSKSDSDSQGAIENIKGTAVHYVDFGSADYKAIGAYDDSLNNKIYWLVYSSDLNHLILEYDVVNNTSTTVISGSALNFSPNRLIVEQNIAIIDGLIYWVNIKPYKINIEDAKAGIIDGNNEDSILAIRPAPNYPPTVKYGSNLDIKTNNVRAKLFQFRCKYVYSDNEESAWSPISKIATPNVDDSSTLAENENKYRPFSYYNTSLNNFIRVSIGFNKIVNPLVKRIKIAFREQNYGDFYLAEDRDVDDILGTVFDFDFYNNESYTSIDNDGNKGMRLFDNVPLESNTQSLIDGNKIAYGGITDNFDPVDIQIKTTPKYTTNTISPPPAFIDVLKYQSFPNQWGFNQSLFEAYDSYAANHLAAINVNGTITTLDRVGTDNFKNVQQGNNTYYLNKGAVTTAKWYLVELSIGNSNIVEGLRYTVKLDIWYYDYGTGNIRSWCPSTQVVVDNYIMSFPQQDRAYRLALKIKDSIAALSLDLGHTIISFDHFAVATWSFGWGQNVSNGTRLLRFRVNGNLKVSAVSNVSGFKNFGKGVYSDVLWDKGKDEYFKVEDAGAIYGVAPTVKVYADWTLLTEKSLKNGANHGIGIVYYDNPNRCGLTNISKEKLFYVPFPTESDKRGNIPPNSYLSSTDLEVEIEHLPPLWAKYYQIVYTGNQTIENVQGSTGYKGFIQFKINDYNSSAGITGASSCKVDELTQFNDQTPESVDIGYGYSKGDRIRFIMNENGDYLSKYADVEIISFDQSTSKLVFKKPDITINSGYTVEIYTPKKQVDDTFYYEVGELRKIINGYHMGDSQDQSATTNAKLLLTDIGDVYMRYRVAPTSRQIEDYHYSDYYKSDSWDKGRVNIVDNNITQTYRPTTIRYSNSYIPETNINGLSRFDDFDFEAYDQRYGSIKLLYSKDRQLNVFQQLKTGRIGVNRSTIYSANGDVSSISRVDKVLNEIEYYAGEYGIGNNPESFAVYGNSMYFTDVKRGVVCRLSSNGIVPISEYKMHNYFNDIFELLDNSSLEYKVIGTYDVRFDEYVLHITNGNIQETIAFSEGKNRWVTFYSFNPEYMISNKTGLISFNDGLLHLHNKSVRYNSFYENLYPSQIKIVSNIEPTKVKLYTNITEDSSDVWKLIEATNQNNQKTSLEYTDFEDVEGVYKAHLFKDENTPNVAYPLIEGDEIRGHSLSLLFENDKTTFTKLFSIGVLQNLSELTNR